MFLRAGELTVHVAIDGRADAPPLLLLHSLGTTLQVWDPQIPALAGRFRVIRPDLRGHGLTAVTPGPYAIDGARARRAGGAGRARHPAGACRRHLDRRDDRAEPGGAGAGARAFR